jgi:hypothetical protein
MAGLDVDRHDGMEKHGQVGPAGISSEAERRESEPTGRR